MSEYWKNYNLSADPFSTDFSLETAFIPLRWKQQLDVIHYLTQSSNTLLLLMGVSGIGKTTMMQTFLAHEKMEFGVCEVKADSSITLEFLQYLMIKHLNIEVKDAPTESFQKRLLVQLDKLYNSNERFILTVDDAHALPEKTLIFLLTLTKAISDRFKASPLHLVLLGGPQLEAKISQLMPENLKEEIIYPLKLEAFSEELAKQYIVYRLQAVDWQGPVPFSEKKLREIFLVTRGIPGKINAYVKHILIKGNSRKEKKPSKKPRSVEKQSLIKIVQSNWKVGCIPFVVLFLGAGMGYLHHHFGTSGVRSVMLRPGTISKEAYAPHPVTIAGRKVNENDSNVDLAATEQQLQSLERDINTTTSAITQLSTEANVPKNVVVKDSSDFDKELLLTMVPSHYTIQLLGLHDKAKLKAVVDKSGLKDSIYYLHKSYSESEWYIVLWGDFDSLEEARHSMNTLPRILQANKPWLRSFASVQRELNAE